MVIINVLPLAGNVTHFVFKFQPGVASQLVAVATVSGMAAIRFLVFGSAEMEGARGVVRPGTLFIP
jgi:hypothetical protein